MSVPSILFGASASAQVDPTATTPAGYVVLLAASEATINTYRAQGLRIIDIDRLGTNSFDAVLVENTGPYENLGETWFAGATEATVSAALAGKRLIDLQPFESGGATLHTAVLVSNTGDDAVPGWGWLYAQTSTAAIDTWMSGSTLRPVSLQRYTAGGSTRWSGVAISDSGAGAATDWFAWGRTISQINSLLSTNGGVITDIEIATQGGGGTQPTFNVVAVNKPIRGWWYYTALDAADILQRANELGARPIDVERYTDATGITKFFVIYVDNTNTLESTMRALMDPATDADYGCYLKEVNGPVLASLNADFPAEIASTMKIVHAVREVQRASLGLEGASGLNTVIFNGDTANPGECPDGNNASPTNEAIRTVLWRMLNNSDNNATLLMAQRCGGNAALTSWLATNGLSGVTLNHTLGCLCDGQGGTVTPNTGPAREICALYEKAATNALFNQTWEDELWGVMFGSNTFGIGRFEDTVDAQAGGLPLTTAQLNQFKSEVWYRFKDGGYSCSYPPAPTRRWGGVAGIVRLPFKALNGAVVPREFVGMTFAHDGQSIQICYDAWDDLFSEQIRAALESWVAACPQANILVQPQPETARVDELATFSLVAQSSQPLTYRWYRYSTPVSDGAVYSGATTPTLTILVTEGSAAQYSCRITTACGSLRVSNAVQLTVLPACPADLDGNDAIGAADLSLLLAAWGTKGGDADLDGDGSVGAADLSLLLAAWGVCP
ncbi:MAG: serine hydrolase [Limnohabitans sp.]|jgi:hypothetical protein|nr:serine hydrolase [Limnohabitans sp.]